MPLSAHITIQNSCSNDETTEDCPVFELLSGIGFDARLCWPAYGTLGEKKWRKCMGIEPTDRMVHTRPNGFEDRGPHQRCKHFQQPLTAESRQPVCLSGPFYT